MGPPLATIFVVSARVRSPLIAVQLCPSFMVLKSTLAAAYSRFGSWGEMTMGNVHWKRYFIAFAPSPMGLSG